ncbi:hypothetical protein GA0115246_104523 [Streptomyces sp. SolWspMP-sol7th]|nr:hypothetical protein GA0115246_104523 [Streptomyces sp. SolWspMP-sol7th]
MGVRPDETGADTVRELHDVEVAAARVVGDTEGVSARAGGAIV